MKDQKVENYRVIKTEIDQIQTTLENLRARGQEISENLPQLKTSVVDAEQAKEKVLDAFVNGGGSKSEVIQAEKFLSESEICLKMELEIQATVNKKISEAEKQLPALQAKQRNAEAEIWDVISDGLNIDLQKIKDQILVAFSANRRRRFSQDYLAFTTAMFPELKNQAELEKYNEQLNELFEAEIA